MKKYLITGLVLTLPLVLTLFILVFIFNMLTEPFVDAVKVVFSRYHLLENGFIFLSAQQIQKYLSQLIVIALFFLFTVGLGWLARWFFVNYLINLWDRLLHRIPFIRSVYKTCQDVINTLFTSNTNSFKQVVMIPFPTPDTFAIGLITKDDLPPIKQGGDRLIAVFVPTTPNPTSGFLVMFEKKDLVYLEMKVEDALKYVISCGMISSPIPAGSAAELLQKLNLMNQPGIVRPS